MPDDTTRPAASPFAFGAFLAWLGITASWWILAFAPLPVPQEWLARARSVCFGTLPNGLPDTYGWILLVLGPLSMLSFLVAVWGPELLATGRRIASRPAGLVGLVVLLTLPATGLAWVGDRIADVRRTTTLSSMPTDDEPLPTHYPRGTEPAPELSLVDQRGQELRLADLRGRPVLLTFAYGHCPIVCPVIVQTSKRGAAAVPHLSPAVVVVTLDPWRDTPRALPALTASWGLDDLPSAHVLSGEIDAVQRVLEAYRVPAVRDERSGDISHPALVYLIDREGRLAYTFNGPSARWIAEGLQKVGSGA